VSIVSLNGTHRSIGAVSLARTIDGLNVVGGTHPSAMATITRGNLSVLYVASTNDDTLALIDTKTDSYLGKIPMQSIVPGTANRVMGQQPDALAASPDGTRLYVAEAGINAVSVYDTSTPSSPRFLGRIPTGWYPSAVTVSPDNTTLYITNAKGYGSDLGFQGQTAGNVPDVNLLFGSVQKVAVGSLDLAAGNTTVQQNTYQILPSDNLAKMANLSTKIHHVFSSCARTKHTIVIWVTMLY
jgi:YVTN family beta-propeller protein